MSKTIKIILLIIGIIILGIISLYMIGGKEVIGQIMDKSGMTSNKYEITVDKEFLYDTFIYWYGETVKGPKDNRLLFYHRNEIMEIPSFYGVNGFEIKYKTITYDRIKFFKTFPYSKYNYIIKIKFVDGDMVVEWKIYNWYDPDVLQGSDTIKIE